MTELKAAIKRILFDDGLREVLVRNAAKALKKHNADDVSETLQQFLNS